MQIAMREVGSRTLRVGVRPGDRSRPPLLLFNGIGANIELVEEAGGEPRDRPGSVGESGNR